MRRIALAGVISSTVIIVTGAAVRLSKSGLGCPDWPQCTRSSLVAAPTPRRSDVPYLDRVRQPAGDRRGHRCRGGGAGSRRGGSGRAGGAGATWSGWPPRSRPAWWRRSCSAGSSVLTDLNPALVSLHFVVSVAVVAAAVALHVRCTEGTAPARSLVRPDLRLLACWRGGGDGGDAGRRDGGHRDRARWPAPGRSPATTCR
jgi:cytochrome c oxidase assembly protein subunit 15